MEEGRGKIIRLPANSSGGEENCNDIVVDRISQLPESIISTVLSFLPTKTAVTTSVLSTKWRFLWTTVFNFHFSHLGCHSGYGEATEEEKNQSMEFAQNVSRVLLHHSSGHINKFCVEWYSKFVIPSFVGGWVSTAFVKHVQELRVVVSQYAPPIEMPIRSIFTSDTLLSLVLTYCKISISSTMPICLPRLEHLKLLLVQFQNPEAFQHLITGCPIIKHVHISLQEPPTSFNYIISSASLTELHFGLDPLSNDTPCRYAIELDAPNLALLELEGSIYWISIRGSLSSLVAAQLRLTENCEYYDWEADYYNSIVLVVRALSSARSLLLSGHVVWAMSYATITLCTKFDRLKELDVGALRYYGYSIADLIQCSENLQVLDLTMECRSIFEEVDPDDLPNNLPSWRNPEDIPICFSNTLKTVKIHKYNGHDEEYAMIDYILQSGSLIEVMEIVILDYVDHKLTLARDICALSRKSPTCKIEFEIW